MFYFRYGLEKYDNIPPFPIIKPDMLLVSSTKNVFVQQLNLYCEVNIKTQSRILLLSHGLEDGLHLLPLLLGQVMRADPLFEELQASLLLSDSKQLLGASLVGGEPNHLSHQIPDKLVVLGQLALGLDRLSLLNLGEN